LREKEFYIYRETKNGKHINDILTVKINPIFETVVQNSLHGGQ